MTGGVISSTMLGELVLGDMPGGDIMLVFGMAIIPVESEDGAIAGIKPGALIIGGITPEGWTIPEGGIMGGDGWMCGGVFTI